MDSTLGEHDPSATTTREVSRAFEESEVTKDEALKKAFKQAFQLGQDYWYQADHEFESQNKKSDVTRAKFEQLMEDAIKEALAQRTWVGLTEQDRIEISDKLGLMDVAWLDLMEAIEAKLKEKNC